MITYRKLICSTHGLQESSFSGEYWIQDGYIQQADSNSDMGHEGYAIQNAAGELLSMFDIHKDEPYLPDLDSEIYEELKDKIPEQQQIEYEGGEISMIELLLWYGTNILKDADFNELVAVAYDVPKSDPRRYAMKNWGWKAIRGVEVDTWNLTSGDMKQIATGIYDVYGDSIEEYSDENGNVDEYGNEGPYFGVEVYSRKDYYSHVPLSVLENGDLSSMRQYRSITGGTRISENDLDVSSAEPTKPRKIIKLSPTTLGSDRDPILQSKLNDLSLKYSNYLYSKCIAYKDYIKLQDLNAKQDAPVGTGSMFMKDLIHIADTQKKLIVLITSNRGFSSGEEYKKTSGVNRLKQFYKKFGFVSTYGKRTYRPDLDGNLYRLPK